MPILLEGKQRLCFCKNKILSFIVYTIMALSFKRISLSLFILLPMLSFSQTLTVELKNVRPQLGGSIYLMLVDSQDKPIEKVIRPLSERNLIFTFKNLKSGSYAVRVFHDQNNNGKLDTGIFGQPIEGWGVSNDARGFMSAPPFKKMLIGIGDKDVKTTIRIDY
jgi:uncharacterized protein (DUF2141 family)